MNGNKIFAGNNEDWKDPYSKMWFYPPENGKHGWIKFGWGSGFPQGGMNDQGLFWDASSCTHLSMPYSEAHKTKYDGALMQKVIEECASTEEALEIFANFYCEDQYKAQYLLGDSLGNSIIVEGDNYIPKEGNYQVLTNFYHSNPDLGGYPCWRYETAAEMLSSSSALSPFFIGSILAATHQEGKYPTQYSVIYDLKNDQLYLFHFHNYEEFITINLGNELSKGYRSYDIQDLFSGTKLNTPANGDYIETTSVTLTWVGIPENNYTAVLSTDPEFSNCISICRKNVKPSPINHSGLPYSLTGLLVFISWIWSKKIIRFAMLSLFVILISYQCKKSESSAPENHLIEMSETFDGLAHNTKYYWKVLANASGQEDFYSETLTRHFNVGN